MGDGRHSKEAANEGRVNSALKIAQSSARIDPLLPAIILISDIGTALTHRGLHRACLGLTAFPSSQRGPQHLLLTGNCERV